MTRREAQLLAIANQGKIDAWKREYTTGYMAAMGSAYEYGTAEFRMYMSGYDIGIDEVHSNEGVVKEIYDEHHAMFPF